MTCHQPRRGLLIFFTSFQMSGQIVVHCARRATVTHLIDPTKLAWYSLVEWHPCCSHCGSRARLHMIPPSSLTISSGMEADRSSTALVQRGPSEAARCASTEEHQPPSLLFSGSKGSARVSFHSFHRARSASKKDIWPPPSLTSQSSHHLRLLSGLPHGTPPHRVSLSDRLSTML